MVLTGALTDIIPALPITDDVLLASVFGGIINGVAVSLTMLNRGSTGGLDKMCIRDRLSGCGTALWWSDVTVHTFTVTLIFEKMRRFDRIGEICYIKE